MFSRFRRQNWIFLLSSIDDTIIGATFQKRGGRYQLGRIQEIENPGKLRVGSCHILLHSPHTNIMHDYFPVLKRGILEMMLDDRVREEGFLAADASYSHAYTVTSRAGKRQKILAVSMPTRMVERGMDLVETTGARRLLSIAPVSASLASLMYEISPEPVLAVIMRRRSCEFILCCNGFPYVMQASPVEQDSDNALEMLLEGLKTVAKQASSTLNINASQVFFLGHGVDYSHVISGGFSVLKPDLDRFVSAQNPTDLSRYPEFATALFAGKRLDYTPQGWRLAYRIQDTACYAGIAAGLAGILMTVQALNIQDEVESYKAHYTKHYQMVAQAASRLSGILPDSEERDNLEKFLAYRRQGLEEPRLDAVLIKVAQAMPAGTTIKHFKASRKRKDKYAGSPAAPLPRPAPEPAPDGPPGLPDASQAAKPELVRAPIKYEMDVVANGKFEDTRTRFEQAIQSMKKWFRITSVSWHYDEDRRQGVMKCHFDQEDSGGIL